MSSDSTPFFLNTVTELVRPHSSSISGGVLVVRGATLVELPRSSLLCYDMLLQGIYFGIWVST